PPAWAGGLATYDPGVPGLWGRRANPRLRESQAGGASFPFAPLLGDRAPGRDAALERHPRVAGGGGAAIHAVGTPGDTPGAEGQDKRLDKARPRQRDVVRVRPDCLRPGRARVALSAERRAGHGQGWVGEGRIQEALDLLLEPAGHRLVVRVDPHRAACDVALDEERVPRAGWGVEGPPVTDARQLWAVR